MQTPQRTPDKCSSYSAKYARTRRRDDRGFQEIPLYPMGCQTGRDRCPLHTRDTHPPTYLNAWRNNLTALSQLYNLYFVASEDVLLVFQPMLPDQHVPSEAVQAFSLPSSRSGRRGHMPGAHPHSVNNMLVDNLGDEEIILCACDDGDVVGFWTKDIMRCVEAAQSAGNSAEGSSHTLRPYFLENVGQSAWGLAVHTEARLLAASSNTQEITVWAPALTKCAPTSAHDSYLDERVVAHRGTERILYRLKPGHKDAHALPNRTAMPRVTLSSRRHRDQRRTLKCHETNIPSIAFCNTPEDPLGRYLASTDIDGSTIVWDVNRGVPARILLPCRDGSNDRHLFDAYDPYQDGWGVLFLNKRSFRRTTSIVKAMGTCIKVQCDVTSANDHPLTVPYKQRIFVYDITESRRTVKNAGSWAGGSEDRTSSNDRRRGHAASAQTQPAILTPPSSGDLAVHDSDREEDPDGSEVDQPFVSASGLPSPSPSPTSGLRTPAFTGGLHDHSYAVDRDRYFDNLSGIIPTLTLPSNVDTLALQRTHWPVLSHHSLHTHSMLPEISVCIPNAKAIPESPLLVMNARSISLFQSGALLNPPNMLEEVSTRRQRDLNSSIQAVAQSQAPKAPGPVIFLDDPLAQDVSLPLRGALDRHDRLNVFTHIPELGVVLVGSPKGRVAVMTLHQLVPDRDAEKAERKANGFEEPVYTMRLDHLLPTREQEKLQQRPMQQLVGVSASPTFGATGARSHERWRVLLLYRDQTVLAYELGLPVV